MQWSDLVLGTLVGAYFIALGLGMKLEPKGVRGHKGVALFGLAVILGNAGITWAEQHWRAPPLTAPDIAAAITKRLHLPVQIDPLTRLETVTAVERRIVYQFMIITDEAAVFRGKVANFTSYMQQNGCTMPDNVALLKAGFSIEMIYSAPAKLAVPDAHYSVSAAPAISELCALLSPMDRNFMPFKPIHWVKTDTKIDFVAKRWLAFGVTLALMLVTVVALAVQGLNLGIDFKGGILLEAKAPQAIDLAALRTNLGALNLGDVTLQEFGSPQDVLIRIQRQTGDDKAQMAAIDKVRGQMGAAYDYRRVEVVGPTVGAELFRAGVLATLFAILAIALYVGIRFEWQFGLAAMIATLHDVLVTVGLFAVLQLDFNLTAVAALLTLAGYSINDTVVVFDRIREILRRQKAVDLATVINDSINQTLSRTIMTAGTTLLALLPLVLFGGHALLNFSLALAWGIIVGTYSSIYVAAALLLYMPPLRQFVARAAGTSR
jgi:preprotein translocase subunit SecF